MVKKENNVIALNGGAQYVTVEELKSRFTEAVNKLQESIDNDGEGEEINLSEKIDIDNYIQVIEEINDYEEEKVFCINEEKLIPNLDLEYGDWYEEEIWQAMNDVLFDYLPDEYTEYWQTEGNIYIYTKRYKMDYCGQFHDTKYEHECGFGTWAYNDDDAIEKTEDMVVEL